MSSSYVSVRQTWRICSDAKVASFSSTSPSPSSTAPFHERVQVARMRRLLSVCELAERAGVSEELLVRVERGEATPSEDVMRKINKALEEEG
jgi:ribosome-binding protein aMBF1 (putative translation factor)